MKGMNATHFQARVKHKNLRLPGMV